jgi:anthranilate phosphoribosyltransferase
MERLLEGGGASAERCAVLLNAAAALYVSGRGWTLAEAVSRARASLESGAAMRALTALRLAAPAGERQAAR